MAEGEKKNLTVTNVVSSPPAKWGEGEKAKEAWTVETEELGKLQIVQSAGTPPPKVGDNLLATVYPPKEGSQYPPSAYPVKPGGGGGRPRNSPEERRSIERQCAAKCVTQLVIAEKVEFANFAKATDRVHAAIKGEW